MQEKEERMLQQEAEIQQQIARSVRERVEIELSMQQIPTGNEDELVATPPTLGGYEQSRRELLQELERQQAANQNLVNMCEEVLSQIDYQRKGVRIKGVKATNDGTALTGFINASGDQLTIPLDVSDVTADNYGMAVSGVVNGLNFKDLRPSRPG